MARKEPAVCTSSKLLDTISTVVVLFVLFSFAGWLYETIENVFSFGGLYLREAFMLPWCPIYGIGGLIIVAVLEPVRKALARRCSKGVELVIVAVGIYALTALVELAGSYACEAIMGKVPWDYSHAWLNFDGRIAPQYTLRFVVLGLVALYGVYPTVARWAQAQPRRVRTTALALVLLLATDCLLQSLGVWGPVKEALVPLGIRHW